MAAKRDYSKLTQAEISEGIRDTTRAIERADKLLKKITDLGAKTPSVLRDLAEPLFRIREHVKEDLAALEDAYDKAEKGKR